MFSPDQLNPLLQNLMSRLACSDGSANSKNDSKKNTPSAPNLAPSQLIVIAGLLGGALEVLSVLVDKDQTIQVVLQGSLKRETELEKMVGQLGSMPFEDVMKAFLSKFT